MVTTLEESSSFIQLKAIYFYNFFVICILLHLFHCKNYIDKNKNTNKEGKLLSKNE